MLKFIGDLTSLSNITAHRLYQAGIQRNGGRVAQAERQPLEARRNDPQAQLWPEVATEIIGADYQRVGNIKVAIEIFKLNLLAYPDSADANDDLAEEAG